MRNLNTTMLFSAIQSVDPVKGSIHTHIETFNCHGDNTRDLCGRMVL